MIMNFKHSYSKNKTNSYWIFNVFCGFSTVTWKLDIYEAFWIPAKGTRVFVLWRLTDVLLARMTDEFGWFTENVRKFAKFICSAKWRFSNQILHVLIIMNWSFTQSGSVIWVRFPEKASILLSLCYSFTFNMCFYHLMIILNAHNSFYFN